VVIPGRQQLFAMQSHAANDIAKFMSRKAKVGGNGKIVEPKLDLFPARTWTG